MISHIVSYMPVGCAYTQALQAELRLLRQERDALEDQVQRFEWAIQHGNMPPAESPVSLMGIEEEQGRASDCIIESLIVHLSTHTAVVPHLP